MRGRRCTPRAGPGKRGGALLADAGADSKPGGSDGRTTTRDALLAAIRDHPDEYTPRLAYADWLDERGDPGDADRAEFIRVQCELGRIPPVVGGELSLTVLAVTVRIAVATYAAPWTETAAAYRLRLLAGGRVVGEQQTYVPAMTAEVVHATAVLSSDEPPAVELWRQAGDGWERCTPPGSPEAARAESLRQREAELYHAILTRRSASPRGG